MLNYIITIAISAFFVPHYLSIFWEPLRTNPWDIIGGAAVILILVAINIVGVKEAAGLNVFLAVVDFATQLLLVIIGFAIVFSPHVLTSNVHWGVAPTWGNFALAIPVAMIAYTGIETVSNLAEEARDPTTDDPGVDPARRGRRVRDLLHAAADRALGAPGLPGSRTGDYVTKLGLPPDQGGFENDPVLGLVENLGLHGWVLSAAQGLRRHPRRDDPVHRHERGRDRRLADHVLDGHLPAAARRSSAGSTRASRRRGCR